MIEKILDLVEQLSCEHRAELMDLLKNQELKDKWGLILGGSGGFGKAAVEILAKHGMNLVVAYRENDHRHEQYLKPEFAGLGERYGVRVETFNGDVFKGEDELFEILEKTIGENNLTFFMHSIAAGICKPAVEPMRPEFGKFAIGAVSDTLRENGIHIDENTLQDAINHAFRNKSAFALHLMAKPERAMPEKCLSDKDIRVTIEKMGTSFGHWIVKLYNSEFFAPFARCVGLTSEGNVRAMPGYNAVGAAKAVLEHSCMALAHELGHAGISITILEAGITDTQALGGIPHSDLMYAQAAMRSATGEVTTAEKVVQILPFLCKKNSRHLTGSVIKINGAEHAL